MNRNFTYILILFLTSLWSNQLFAQGVQGKVTSVSGESISKVSIVVLNSTHGVSSDLNGGFSIALPVGAYQLAASAVGYASQIKKVVVSETKTPVTLNFVMVPYTQSLDEIVVTAQKTEQNILHTSTAVSTLSTQKIEDTRTWDFTTLNGIIPNYLYIESGVSFQQIQSIRGMQVFSENPAVATYVDGVNQLDILANGFQLMNVERIEVLRGPQGTLFGRNAMGGVINVITKQPSNKTNGFAEVSLGNLGLQRYSLGFQTPLIKNKLFLGVDGLFQRKEGFLRNDTTGTATTNAQIVDARVGDEDTYYGNVHLKWLPTDNFSVALNIKGQLNQSNASSYFVFVKDEVTALAQPDKVYLSKIGTHKRNVVNTALSLNYYAPTFTLSSISTYQRIGLAFEDIVSGRTFSSYKDGQLGAMLNPQQVYSQELKIASNKVNSPLTYTAGIYGFTQNAYEPTTNLASEVAKDTYAILRNEGNNWGTALFGQATYAITDKVAITAGLRYDFEHRENTFNGFGDLLDVTGTIRQNKADTTVSGEYSAFSPKLALTYTFTDASSAYVSYTRGFRAGGINAQRLPNGLDHTFDPEFSNNFELGYKASFLNKRMYVSATAFYINWTNLQFSNLVAPPFTFARENIGDATSWGLELEVSAIPVKNLQIEASTGFNNTEYKDFALTRLNLQTLAPVITQVGGNRLSNAPQNTLYVATQYTFPLARKIGLVARGEFRNIGSYFTDIQNDLEQKAYNLISGRIGVRLPWMNLFFWVQNLTNERYIEYGASDTSFNRATRMAAPRTWGITLTAKY